MMNNKSLFKIALAALIAVGVAVWPLPKAVKAAQPHTILCVDQNNNPVEGALVQVEVLVSVNPVLWAQDWGNTDDTGLWTMEQDPHSTATFWVAEVLEPPAGYTLDDLDNPRNVDYPTSVTVFHFTLEIP